MRAAHLLGAADVLRQTLGASLTPAERVRRDGTVAAVRVALGSDTYLAAYEAGLSLTPEQAVATALDHPA